MMKSIAGDEVWIQISWQKTENKESFPKFFDAFYTAILKICSETLPVDCNRAFCDSRIKTFLRHGGERKKRNEKANLNEEE